MTSLPAAAANIIAVSSGALSVERAPLARVKSTPQGFHSCVQSFNSPFKSPLTVLDPLRNRPPQQPWAIVRLKQADTLRRQIIALLEQSTSAFPEFERTNNLVKINDSISDWLILPSSDDIHNWCITRHNSIELRGCIWQDWKNQLRGLHVEEERTFVCTSMVESNHFYAPAPDLLPYDWSALTCAQINIFGVFQAERENRVGDFWDAHVLSGGVAENPKADWMLAGQTCWRLASLVIPGMGRFGFDGLWFLTSLRLGLHSIIRVISSAWVAARWFRQIEGRRATGTERRQKPLPTLHFPLPGIHFLTDAFREETNKYHIRSTPTRLYFPAFHLTRTVSIQSWIQSAIWALPKEPSPAQLCS